MGKYLVNEAFPQNELFIQQQKNYKRYSENLNDYDGFDLTQAWIRKEINDEQYNELLQRVHATNYEGAMNSLNITGSDTGKAINNVITSGNTPTPTTSTPTTSTMPTINDTTYSNIDNPVNTIDLQSYIDFQMQQREEQWAREDAIRKETQAREDNAWQRAVADMEKAGVNPNLVNAGPASSGGGITTASGLDYSLASSALSAGASIQNALINATLQKDLQVLNAELQKYLAEYNGDVNKALEVLKEEHAIELENIAREHEEELLRIGKSIDQNFDREENKKDRVIDLVGILVALGGSLMNAFK